MVEDHPRLRGEQFKTAALSGSPLGSPPLVRGTGSFGVISIALHRITPACAGNRKRSQGQKSATADHPRLRGEQRTNATSPLRVPGSPPLARGTVQYDRKKKLLCRITPACAGNSSDTASCQLCAKDHPRLRGEQSFTQPWPRPPGGSPPLARGTASPSITFSGTIRITPACAGNRIPV